MDELPNRLYISLPEMLLKGRIPWRRLSTLVLCLVVTFAWLHADVRAASLLEEREAVYERVPPTAPVPQTRADRMPGGYVHGFAGLTFEPKTDGLAGAGAGINVTPLFQVFGEFGYMRNIISREEQEAVDATNTGDVERNQTRSVLYGMGGMRFIIPTSRYAFPYVTVAGGLTRLQESVRFTMPDGTDFTNDLRVIGDPEAATREVYESVIGIGGGVSWETAKGLSFDVGYRYFRVFDLEPTNVGTAYFAIGYAFKRSPEE